MIITLGGTPGSGKSTLGKILAKDLGYEFLSMGKIRRDFAKDNGMTIEELNEKAKTDRSSDDLVDNYLKELGKKDSLIIDSRMAWHFIPQSFKVWVKVSDEEGARRIFNHQREEESYSSIEEVKEKNVKRLNEDKDRYFALYSVDYTELNNYDFVIDTTSVSAEEAARIILDEINKESS
jgi:cytidylate kinase